MIDLDYKYHAMLTLLLIFTLTLPFNAWLLLFLLLIVIIRNFYSALIIYILYEISLLNSVFYDSTNGFHNSTYIIVVFFILNYITKKYSQL